MSDSNTPGKLSASRVKSTAAYRVALARAGKLLKNPAQLGALVGQARDKARRGERGPLASLGDSLGHALRLVKAYSRGDYRDVSWHNLVLIVAALVYLVAPVDLILDFIPGFGLIDDAMLLTWTFATVQSEITRFLAWEQRSQGDEPLPPADNCSQE
ncbi:MAG: YkvA family protein [Porticoccaceae bacterium]|jgi:uncharacterized membrane protein YkvA (DUF1232 family)